MANNVIPKNDENINLMMNYGNNEEKYEKNTVSDSGTFIDRASDSVYGMIRLHPVPEVHPNRWFILATITFLNLCNAMLYYTFAMIADSTALYYKISLSDVNWLSIVVLLGFVIVGPISIWLLDKYGLRVGIVVNGWVTLLGASIRVLSAYVPAAGRIPTLFIGQGLIALGQPVILATTTKMAAVWFPDEERILANTIATLGVTLGMMVSSVLSPAITNHNYLKMPILLIINLIPVAAATLMATIGMKYSKPPNAPSFIMMLDENPESTWKCITNLLKSDSSYQLLAITVATHFAVLGTVGVLIEQILCPAGYPDDFAGLCIVIMTMCGFIAAVIILFFIRSINHFEVISKVFLSLANLSLIGFFMSAGYRNCQGLLCLFAALYGIFGMSLVPMMLELCVECSYPVDEVISSGVLFLLATIISVVMIIVLPIISPPLDSSQIIYSACHHSQLSSSNSPSPMISVPDTAIIPRDYSWATVVMVGLLTLATLIYVIFFQATYKRKAAEDNHKFNCWHAYRLETVSPVRSGDSGDYDLD
ncbi:Major facilitator superfamily domain-containing protein 7-a [Trichoplax sp. H2]|nr:Major facilitator superfamily domain-containing protein 7-a [Trichoplax sp. H2]|eukprot:RDD38794.1 Major facilitator superfamily domain-containing protein 7-a [Trichoplax sp. H2]